MKDLKLKIAGYAGGMVLATLCLAALNACSEDRERPVPPKGDGTINMLYVAGPAGKGLNSPKLMVNEDGSFSYRGRKAAMRMSSGRAPPGTPSRSTAGAISTSRKKGGTTSAFPLRIWRIRWIMSRSGIPCA